MGKRLNKVGAALNSLGDGSTCFSSVTARYFGWLIMHENNS